MSVSQEMTEAVGTLLVKGNKREQLHLNHNSQRSAPLLTKNTAIKDVTRDNWRAVEKEYILDKGLVLAEVS